MCWEHVACHFVLKSLGFHKSILRMQGINVFTQSLSSMSLTVNKNSGLYLREL